MVQPSSALQLPPIKSISTAGSRRRAVLSPPPDFSILNADSPLPRIAMVSTHGYVAAIPPLGAADTGGQVVYVLELSKKLAELGYEVDIWTRRFDDQSRVESVSDRVRILRVPCGGPSFIPKERLSAFLGEWCGCALDFIRSHELRYKLINSHYWDAGIAGASMARTLGVPHAHTPHSLGIWKQRQMGNAAPDRHEDDEAEYNFEQRINS